MRRMNIGTRALGALVLGGSTTFVVLVYAGLISLQKLPGSDERFVVAHFAQAGELRKDMAVRIDGVRVGSVQEVTYERETGTAAVKMDVAEDAGPLYADASAEVRWKTVLGGAFYVRLNRGRASTGPLQGDIAAKRTSTQVELDDVLSFDRGKARQGLLRLPKELSETLRDPAPLSDVLREVDRQAPDLTQGLNALRGQQKERDLKALIGTASATVRALDTPANDTGGLVQNAAATLQTTAARQAELRQALSVAPAALAGTRQTLTRLDRTLALLRPVVADLDEAAPKVAPTVSDLRPTVRGADRLLERAVPLLADLRPSVRSLARTAVLGKELLTTFDPGLKDLDERVLPLLNEVDPTSKRTTAQMIGPSLEGLGPAISGQEDQNGHFIRFPATVGSSTFYLPCQTYINNPDAASLVACESLGRTLERLFGYRPNQSPPGTDDGSGTEGSSR